MNKLAVSIIMLLAGVSYASADIDLAKRYYNTGEYSKALNELQVLAKKSPKDAAVNYYLGATLYRLGELQEAVAPLKIAENANWPVAARDLTEINLKVLNLDAASDHIDRWAEILDKKKASYPDEYEDLRERVLIARNMLERVEKIQIIETMQVDSVDFFNNYMLASSAGELLDATFLPDRYAAENPRVVYQPQSGKEMFWGRPDDDGHISLVVADILDDGTVSDPLSLGDEINSTGDADFPFLLQDGFTIYYASKGEGSLGGYDIFMTRRSADGTVLQPQNVGMPYNSPYNDYMMVIDESRNIGWWASDREHIPGKVTIYTFVPSTMRVNHNPDDPKINDYALLRKVDLSNDLDQRISDAEDDTFDETVTEEFFLPMGNGKVYTRLSQFRNNQARQAMRDLLKRMFDLEVMQAELDEMRAEYAKGKKAKSQDILKLENSVRDANVAIEHLTNQIISLETR